MIDRGLVFEFADMIEECQVIKDLARPFLDPGALLIIDEAKRSLQNIKTQGSTTTTTRWSIPENRLLRTKWSEGDCQRDQKSRHHVCGEFSFVWEIRPLDDPQFPRRTHFLLDGLASASISITEKSRKCVAQWTVEVGDHQSPGAHFHSQIKRFGGGPTLESLDVPRLPALLMSPFFVLEFGLGELFQDRWPKHARRDSTPAQRWRAIHLPRLTNFLKWQLAELAQPSVGSPWVRLKAAKPPIDLLIKK